MVLPSLIAKRPIRRDRAIGSKPSPGEYGERIIPSRLARKSSSQAAEPATSRRNSLPWAFLIRLWGNVLDGG